MIGCVFNLVEHCRIANQIGNPKFHQSGLRGAENLPGPA
jgi:hypothetical protein